jgi:zinc protease
MLKQTRSLPSRFNSNGAFLTSMTTAAEFGLSYNVEEKRSTRLQQVTIDDIKAVAEETIKPEEMTWVIVGDLWLVEQGIRELNLGTVEVWDPYGNKLR